MEGTYDSVVTPDGAALSAFQYFENVRNFLVALEEMGLPSFEASDLEQVSLQLHWQENDGFLVLQICLNFWSAIDIY